MNRQINRANQLWQNWQDKQKMLEDLFSGNMPEHNFCRQKYDFLKQGIMRISVNAMPDEKIVLDLLKGITAKLEKQLYPKRLVRLLLQVKNLVYDRPRYLKQQAVLRADNLESLKKDLDSKGMGSFSGRLGNYLDFERDRVNIDLSTQLSGTKRLDVTLHLTRDETGRYQLPEFTAGIMDKEFPAQKREYTFEADGWTDMKTAANLLQGRPVFYQTAATGTKLWLCVEAA